MEPDFPRWVLDIVADLFETSGPSFLLGVVAVLVTLTFLIVAVAKTIEGIAKIVELFTPAVAGCVSAFRGGRVHKEAMKRKRQFLGVLLTDLAGIGKAEAWNDQQFTDLEAEVEIEGAYYRSSIERLLRTTSTGLRRERSLVGAIHRSSEKCLLLTGDPGSGKSVALRHLALQMIHKSLKSTTNESIVPLYVNLREINLPRGSPITVDAIKAFVIDNMRRGDADTAEFIKSNWIDFQARGIWFFLFDSFDEIPAVMHAAANDTSVIEYGRAIQQFIDGLNGCRGVLASRAYKSPTSLAWPRLRILPLSEQKQEELIQNTFLTDRQKAIALRAISRSASMTYKNPLFLTLLCRYVRENLIAPANEHELLYAQVNSLSKRDSQYVVGRWGLTPDQLTTAASELARLFATSPDIGLAPTIDEIHAAAVRGGLSVTGSSLVAAIEALTYVKIGRTDVASLDSSVRRFAFAHRRYQECLFAAYLAKNPGAIDPLQLITDARWRDYLVALLQIAEPRAIESLVAVAANFVASRSGLAKIKHRSFYGREVRSCAWGDEELEHVLSLILEAKRYWPEGPWAGVENSVEMLLDGLWRKGDYYDRAKVMKYCGIGGQASLLKRVEFSMKSGIPRMEELAIDACRFIVRPTSFLSGWVRKHVIARMITARRRFDFLRWEAIASELPSDYQMSIPLERANVLYGFAPISRSITGIADIVDRSASALFPKAAGSGHRHLVSRVRVICLQAFYFLTILVAAGVAMLKGGVKAWEAVALLALAAVVLGLLKYAIQIASWHIAERLGIRVLLAHARSAITVLRRHFLVLGFAFVILATPGVLLYWICRVTGMLPSHSLDLVPLGSALFVVIVGTGVSVWMAFDNSRVRHRAKTLLERSGGLFEALSEAESGEEVAEICRQFVRQGGLPGDVRTAVAYLSVMFSLRENGPVKKGPNWLSHASMDDLRSAISTLLMVND